MESKGHAPLSDELRAKVEALIESTELVDVRPCEMEARIEDGVAPGTVVDSVRVELAVAYAVGEGVYGNRFEFAFTLLGEVDDEPIGYVGFTFLVDYKVRDGFTPDREAAEYLVRTTGYFAVYPYARELFQSLAGRLQFDPLVLGMIKRNTIAPGAINVLLDRPRDKGRQPE